MTKREAAIIELYTGICMLTGDWTIVNKVDRRREKNQKSSSN